MARKKTVGQLPMTDTELIVMRCFWIAKKDLFAVDVIALLNSEFDIHYANQTVSVLLMHLKDKGYLKFERIGRGYKFIPDITEEEYYNRQINKNIVDLGSVESLLAAFMASEKIKDEDKTALKKILKQYK
jgi:BlaI family penicillinase repressor